MKEADKKIIFLIFLLLYLLFFLYLPFFGIFDMKGFFLFLFGAFICFHLISIRYPDAYINKLNTYLSNLIIISLAIFFSIIFVEISVHIIKPDFMELDKSKIGDFTDFTSRGYLDEKILDKKRSFRILGLGDSFARNLSEENKNFHDFLQNMFDKKYGERKIRVINAGMEATGPGYYYHILKKYGNRLKPDLVLVGFTVSNDFMELNFDTIQIGEYIYLSRDIAKRFSDYFRFKNFWIYQFLKRRGREIYENMKIEEEMNKKIVKEKGSFSEETFLKIINDSVWQYEKYRKYDLEKIWDLSSFILSRLKNWCNARKVKLIIAIFPSQFQTEDPLRQKIFKKYDLNKDSINLYYPNKLVFDFCKQSDIYCIDLTKSFQEEAKFKKLFLIRDTHWNEYGNKLAADILFDYIEKNKLVDLN